MLNRLTGVKVRAELALLVLSALVSRSSEHPAEIHISAGVTDVTELGAKPDGTDVTQTTAAFLSAFSRSPSGRIRVPAGRYLIDNSKGPLTVVDFGGELRFEKGAQVVFTDNSLSGFLFVGGSGARISGFRADYLSPPRRRNSPQEQLKFSDTIDTVLSDTVVEHSPAAGILFYNCVRPRVFHATVLHSLADGLHFANCQDAEVADLTTSDTGDDGLAFLNYARYPDKQGGRASNIHVLNSHTRGITVVGQSHVTISDFTINNTCVSGILCARDRSFDTRIPRNVRFTDGRISNAGVLGPAAGNKYGIEFNEQLDCEFSRITVIRPAFNGLSGTAPNGRVAISDVRVQDVRSGSGFHFYRTEEVDIVNSASVRTPSYGFMFNHCARVHVSRLFALDSSETDPLRRAVWFENGGIITASQLTIGSSRPERAHRIVGAYQDSGGHQTGEVRSLLSVGREELVPIESNCPEEIGRASCRERV